MMMLGGCILRPLTIIIPLLALLLFSALCVVNAAAIDAIPLSPGWNFVSFPLDPPNKTPAEVLKEVSPNVRLVWGYDNANKRWLKYKPGTVYVLSVMEAGKGYWIYMDSSANLSMTSWTASQNLEDMYTGWNLVGYDGPDAISAADAVANISKPWSVIWNWTAGTWYAKYATVVNVLPPILPLETVYQGRAYWFLIKATSGLPPGVWDSSTWDNCNWGT